MTSHMCFISELFPQTFEGGKVQFSRALSSHFQVNHNLTLSNPMMSGYRFGATYVGTKQLGPQEVTLGSAYKQIWIWDQVHAQAPDRSDFDIVKIVKIWPILSLSMLPSYIYAKSWTLRL